MPPPYSSSPQIPRPQHERRRRTLLPEFLIVPIVPEEIGCKRQYAESNDGNVDAFLVFLLILPIQDPKFAEKKSQKAL
jgi:hypothetical protein